MLDHKKILLSQLSSCLDQNEMYVSFQNAVDGLTKEQAAIKTREGSNSIWEIINHLNYWNEYFLDDFKGVAEKPIQNDMTFKNEDLEWDETVKKYKGMMTEWRLIIKDKKNEEKIEKDWSASLSELFLHNAYHIGQIVTIRKTNGNWDPSKGVS